MIKIKICEQAERLKNSTEWELTSKKFIQLQKEWKESPLHLNHKSSQIFGIDLKSHVINFLILEMSFILN